MGRNNDFIRRVRQIAGPGLRKHAILFSGGLILGLGVIYLVYALFAAQPGYRGVLIDPPHPVADFTLQADQGEIHLADYRGKVVLLFFGYTYCPEVCPTTLADLSRAMKNLGSRASQVQTIFISVDPERDTPQRLGEYARAFSPNFIGATSTPDEIALIAKQYGIYYQKVPAKSGTGYTMDHTAVVWVIDAQGNLRLEWPYGFETANMVSDLKQLLKDK
jgi:protein SCO1